MKRLVIPLATAVLALALVPAARAAQPTITNTSVSGITTTSATLQAEVNPQGKATKYHFEYGTAPCDEVPDPCTQAPEGKLSVSSNPEAISAPLAGLAQGTTYYFRAVAQNADSPKGGTLGPELSFATYVSPQAFGACPNDSFRTGASAPTSHPSALLPDCRAYEQISPVQKGGQDILGTQPWLRASPDGASASFLSSSGLPGLGAGGHNFPAYVASRTASGWSTRSILPPASFGESMFIRGWTPDFSQVFSSLRHIGDPDSMLVSVPAAGSAETLVPYGSGLGNNTVEPFYVGSSEDGTLTYFESRAALPGTAGLAGKPNVYGWDAVTGRLFLAAVMNDALPPLHGSFGGPYAWIGSSNPSDPGLVLQGGVSGGYYTQPLNAVSADGSLYFTSAGDGQLYLRRNPSAEQSAIDGQGRCTEPAKACTTHISASEMTEGKGPGGHDAAGTRPAAFLAASEDGSRVLLSSSEKLTNDATTGTEPPPPAIGRSSFAGNDADTSFLPGAVAAGVTVFGDHIYWADPADHAIGRARLNPETGAPEEVEPHFILPGETAEFETKPLSEPGVLHSAAAAPLYVAVDEGHVYWTDVGPLGGESETSEGGIASNNEPLEGAGTIGRAALDGSGELVPGSVEDQFIKGATDPQGIALGPCAEGGSCIYWSNAGTEALRSIGRAKLGGEEVNIAFIDIGKGPQNNRPQGIAVDSSHIYVTIDAGFRREHRFIDRYDIDGNPTSEFFRFDETNEQVSGVRGIALDGSHVYWARQGNDTIGRCDLNLEAASCDREFIKGAGHPFGLAADGSHLYWSVNGETQPNPGNDLYRYDTEPDSEGDHLTDLTVDPDLTHPAGAEVKGVLGASRDLSYVYFVANGDLDGSGGEASPGDCQGEVAGNTGNEFQGECNLYLSHGGQVDYVARLKGKLDFQDWQPRSGGASSDRSARVSADGRTLLFTSTQQLTSYDNRGSTELYRYHVGDPQPIICVSCNPTGQTKAGSRLVVQNFGFPFLGPADFLSHTLTRNLSADGKRVFFETTEALVGADTNGGGGCPVLTTSGSNNASQPVCFDVYEWEAPGTPGGTCQQGSPPYTAQNGGCLYLLSGGREERPSFFLDASESGDDAFIVTPTEFVGQDGDQLYDAYDARVDGGLAYQSPLPAEPCVETEACKPAATAKPDPGACGSACFAGPGNPKPPKPCPKGKKRRGGKCVPKHPRRHRHGRQHRGSHRNRGGSR